MEWLDSFKEKLGTDAIYCLFLCLISASRELKRFEESIVYEKESLKLIVKAYNSGESVKVEKTPVRKIDLMYGGFQLMTILGLLGMYFDAVVVFVTKS